MFRIINFSNVSNLERLACPESPGCVWLRVQCLLAGWVLGLRGISTCKGWMYGWIRLITYAFSSHHIQVLSILAAIPMKFAYSLQQYGQSLPVLLWTLSAGVVKLANQIHNLFQSITLLIQVTLHFLSQLVTPLNIHGEKKKKKNIYKNPQCSQTLKPLPKSRLVHWINQPWRHRRNLCRAITARLGKLK